MDDEPTLVATFANLDEAESALDWIGVGFSDAEGGFEGRVAEDERDPLEAAIADPDAPGPVRDLAAALLRLLDAGEAVGPSDGAAGAAGATGASWRVAFAD